MEAVSLNQRKEISVQTDRIVIIRRRRSRRVWCQRCGREVDAIAVQETMTLAGGEQLVLPRNPESGAWHIWTDEHGERVVCLESLCRQKQRR